MSWDDDASRHWQNNVWDCLKYLWLYLYDWIDYTIHWNPRYRELAWEGMRAWAKLAFKLTWDRAEKAYRDAKDYADGLIEGLGEVAGNVWDSITFIWARFGAGILDTSHTVESWIRAKLDFMYGWAIGQYRKAKEWVSDWGTWVVAKANEACTWIETWADRIVSWIENKAGIVWDWISAKANAVWTWITGIGAALKGWYDRNYTYYSELYDKYRNLLWAFLEDPETFILDYVVDGVEYVVSWAVTRFW